MRRKPAADLTKLKTSQLSLLTGLCHTTIRNRLADLEPVETINACRFYSSPDALAAIYIRPDTEILRLRRNQDRMVREFMALPENFRHVLNRGLSQENTTEALRGLVLNILGRCES